MIVLGVAPGLSELAYSVLAFHAAADQADPIDADVLHAGRGPTPNNPFHIAKRSHVHHMILGVIAERHTPALFVLGPACRTKEPTEHVESVRLVLRVIAMGIQIPVIDLSDKLEMVRALGADQRSWRSSVDALLRRPLGSADRRIVLATATAVAGVQIWRRAHGLLPASESAEA